MTHIIWNASLICATILSVLEWVIVTEILTMLWLGVALLCFLFKCMKALKVKRRGRVNDERCTPEQTPSHWNVSVSLSGIWKQGLHNHRFDLFFLITFYFVFACSSGKKKRCASPSQSEDVGHCCAPAVAVPSGANRSSFRQR
jgi:hypothetical protein